MSLKQLSNGKDGFTCSMCGVHIRVADSVRAHGLWAIHVKNHEAEVVEGAEAMLRDAAE